MFSGFELIIIAVFVGVTVSQTTLLEKVKVWLIEHRTGLIAKALDCPLCASFWTAMFLNIAFFSNLHDLILNTCTSAILGYFIGKE